MAAWQSYWKNDWPQIRTWARYFYIYMSAKFEFDQIIFRKVITRKPKCDWLTDGQTDLPKSIRGGPIRVWHDTIRIAIHDTRYNTYHDICQYILTAWVDLHVMLVHPKSSKFPCFQMRVSLILSITNLFSTLKTSLSLLNRVARMF